MVGDYVITEHLIHRLRERFYHLDLSWNDRWTLYQEINQLIRDSYNERRYLNNTDYLCYLYETYGYDVRYEFLVNKEKDIVFVVALHHGKRKIVKTCLSLHDSDNFTPVIKYKNHKEGKKSRQSLKNGASWIHNELVAQEEYEIAMRENMDLSKNK